MAVRKKFHQFIFPSPTPKVIIRMVLVALSAYLFFGHICIPIRIKGGSMEPTYGDKSINFCSRLRYIFSAPLQHDLVLVRFAGNRVMLLKRVVALEGETVEFRSGKLFVDGVEVDEPYVRYPCNWNLPPRRVKKDCVYVVGDNRNMSIENHNFGQASIKRIAGAPLW
jgi:signal peptidase I